MLSIKSINASSTGAMANYYQNLASRDDYYEKNGGEEPPGYWLGGCAAELGLVGEIKDGQLLSALTGHDPATGEALAKNAGEEHKPGWDCTYSAPKSVSAVWAVADQEMREKIEQAHRQAVAESINYIEANAAFTRHGHGGAVKVPASENGGLLVAVYEHHTSRNQDPQIHSHCIVANLNKDGRGIDLDTGHKMAAGALYRAEFAHQLQKIGFEIERDGKSFAVKGVPTELVEKWSSRRNQIEDHMAKSGENGAIASQRATLETREKKDNVSHVVLHEKWQKEALAYEFSADKVNQLCDPSRQKEGVELPASGKKVVTELTDKNATFTRLQALHMVAIDGQGKLSAAQILYRLPQVLKDGEAISLGDRSRADVADTHMKRGDRYTTSAVLKMEKEMLDGADRLNHKQGFEVSSDVVQKCAIDKGLSAQQTRALEHLTNQNSASVVQGHAGAGKSYLLSAGRDAWESEGYDVRGAALSNAAAQNLHAEAGIASTSIAKLVHDLESGQTALTSKTVLVIDEAGMVGSRQTQYLIEKCEQAGAKIVLVGDTMQLQSIEAGAAMRAVAEKIGMVELDEVRRQVNQIDKEIANDFREGRAGEALDKLDKLDRLHVGQDMRAAQADAVKGYLADREEGKSVLLIAATRAEVQQLNASVRAELVERGEVKKEGVCVKVSSGYREFSEGDQIVFGEKQSFGERDDDSKTVINGSRGTVLSATEYAGAGVSELQVKLDKSGEIVNVRLEPELKIDHGYSTTVHKSQGATVDQVHVVVGERAGLEWSYVAGSRHRDEVHVYTSVEHHTRPEEGKELASDLSKQMSQSQAKDVAHDYAKPSPAASKQAEDDHGHSL
jgi:Ti-type conjugative transfer relaxase TraA